MKATQKQKNLCINLLAIIKDLQYYKNYENAIMQFLYIKSIEDTIKKIIEDIRITFNNNYNLSVLRLVNSINLNDILYNYHNLDSLNTLYSMID